jgi:hypothetical protein
MGAVEIATLGEIPRDRIGPVVLGLGLGCIRLAVCLIHVAFSSRMTVA